MSISTSRWVNAVIVFVMAICPTIPCVNDTHNICIVIENAIILILFIPYMLLGSLFWMKTGYYTLSL